MKKHSRSPSTIPLLSSTTSRSCIVARNCEFGKGEEPSYKRGSIAFSRVLRAPGDMQVVRFPRGFEWRPARVSQNRGRVGSSLKEAEDEKKEAVHNSGSARQEKNTHKKKKTAEQMRASVARCLFLDFPKSNTKKNEKQKTAECRQRSRFGASCVVTRCKGGMMLLLSYFKHSSPSRPNLFPSCEPLPVFNFCFSTLSCYLADGSSCLFREK